MNLFRSEEHVGRWLEGRGYEGGETVALGTLSELALTWYGNRLAGDWRPRTADESWRILDSAGLTSPFWQL